MKADGPVELLDRPMAAGRYLMIPDTFLLDDEGIRTVTLRAGKGTETGSLLFEVDGRTHVAAGPTGGVRARWIKLDRLQ